MLASTTWEELSLYFLPRKRTSEQFVENREQQKALRTMLVKTNYSPFQRNYAASLTRSKWEKSDSLLIRFPRLEIGRVTRESRDGRFEQTFEETLCPADQQQLSASCQTQLLHTGQASNNQQLPVQVEAVELLVTKLGKLIIIISLLKPDVRRTRLHNKNITNEKHKQSYTD